MFQTHSWLCVVVVMTFYWESVSCEFKWKNFGFWKEKPSLIRLFLNSKQEQPISYRDHDDSSMNHPLETIVSLVPYPVADPGFSPGGCANGQKCYYFSNICQKLHENERIWTPRGGGGARPWRPP